MTDIVRILAVLLGFISWVSAALYGTSPVATSVWSAGRSVNVTWIDDGKKPTLEDMGLMDLELWHSGGIRVSILAKNIEPRRKHQSVWVSPSWGHNGSDYYIRFVCHKPHLTVYSSSFTFIDKDDASSYATSPTTTSSFDSISMYTPLLTLVLPDTTVVSHLAPQPITTPNPLSHTNSASYITRIEHAESEPSVHDPRPTMTKSSRGSVFGRPMDLERIKFRLVFIFWPTLVGLTMAL